MRLALIIAASAGLPLLAAVGFRPPAVPPPRDADLDAAVDDFFETLYGFHPSAAVRAGFHAYDERTEIRDRATIEAYLAALADLERRFEALDEAALDDEGRLDRALVLRRIADERFWLEELGRWRHDPRFYAGPMDLTYFLLAGYAPLPERAPAIAVRLEGMPGLVAAARANVERPPRPFVETALVAYRNLPAFLERDLPLALEGLEDDELRDRIDRAAAAAASAVRGYAAELEALLADGGPDAFGDYALGPERYRRMNALLAGVDLPIDRLASIGEAELDRLERLAGELAIEITGDDDIAAAFDSIAGDAAPGGAIAATAADQIAELRAFVGEAGFGTVLPGDVEVREIPPFRRTNFAYIVIPGAYEEGFRSGIYFIQPVESGWSEAARREFLARNNRWAILNTSGHEAYPGHYHHYNHVHRAPTKTQRLLTAYVTTEGWAHYAEEAVWEAGLAGRDPRLGLAMVQDALLRALRYRVSIGLHAEGMSVDEAERLFRRVAHQDSVNARQQALRGTYDPEYLNYTLGKLMIGRLRDAARDRAEARGEPFDLGRFHDDFMAAGAPPVTWIGRRLLDDPAWRPFGG